MAEFDRIMDNSLRWRRGGEVLRGEKVGGGEERNIRNGHGRIVCLNRSFLRDDYGRAVCLNFTFLRNGQDRSLQSILLPPVSLLPFFHINRSFLQRFKPFSRGCDAVTV